MREIHLNGYIDDEVWVGDEITPDLLHAVLYGEQNQFSDEVHIRLNSYGGACNAATRMFDDIRAYPGHVRVTISGTAASAATVLAMAADILEMTPGSLFMIHDPSVLTWGNERDLMESVQLLRACKESILNMYGTRCKLERTEIARLMNDTCWMDAAAALEKGFIDGIVQAATEGTATNAAAPRSVDRKEAEQKVQAWLDRRKPKLSRHTSGDDPTSSVSPAPELEPRPDSGGTVQAEELPTTPTPESTGTPIAQLEKRLGLIMPRKQTGGRHHE